MNWSIVSKTAMGLVAATLVAACQPHDPAAKAGSDTAASGNGAAKTYNVAMNANFPPFESTSTNGEIVGFDVDLMNAIAKQAGIKITYKNQPWDGIFQTLTSGDNDILISGITITPERKETMAFSDPYFEVKQVILVPKGQDVKSINDLNKLTKVGVTTGTTGDTAAQKILGTTSPKIARFESLPLVIKDLQDGGVQAMVSDSAVVANFIKQNGDKGFSMVEVPDFPKEEYGIAVRKNDTDLLNKINDGLKKVRDSGEYDQIYSKYFAK
ncbi:basic amino acid ABC transporter substrate-binding protein [Snodgrassella sp. CFCC 13594]|uniref:basic amino acid ABC transporter substrate-binding protein n=1 Tax=Snodgrassella sp. CFCC 13594 TaxID=1775559 RepID=UPI00082C189D|nr:basic amino acid ABC transporter substrate-binding protein [Snodgrassella sp. CFCC 13594]